MNINTFGTLYVVATPIGNLDDISARALRILQSVDCVIAEDSRHSRGLLQHFGITQRFISLHEHNEAEKSLDIVAAIQSGKTYALISDAGTPLISDPGYKLVKAVLSHNLPLVPIPGPCAAIVALSVSGLPTDRFMFEGFLPAKTKARSDVLTQLSFETRTLIFYEAPHRILATLQDMQTVFGPDRVICVARELTKIFETIKLDTAANLVKWVSNDANQQKGEIVLMVSGANKHVVSSNQEIERLLNILLPNLSLKQAVDCVAQITNEKKNHIYDLALVLKGDSSS